MDAPMKWLIFHGLVPLIGSGAMFCIWGLFSYIASTDRSNFQYSWREVFDSLGWLYGSIIIAVNTAFAGLDNELTSDIAMLCFVAAAVCMVFLCAAMNQRGSTPNWHPPAALTIVAAALSAGILFAAFRTQVLLLSKGAA